MDIKWLNRPSFFASLLAIIPVAAVLISPAVLVSQVNLQKRLDDINPSPFMENLEGVLVVIVALVILASIVYLATIMYKRTLDLRYGKQPETILLWLLAMFFTLPGIFLLATFKTDDTDENQIQGTYLYLPFGKSIKPKILNRPR